MSNLELKLEALKSLYRKINFCWSLANNKGYNDLLTNKHRREVENLKSQIEYEIESINQQISSINNTFTYGNILDCIKNEFSDFSVRVQEFCINLSTQSETLAAEIIRDVESHASPIWLWSSTTASPVADIELFLTSQHKDFDNFFINYLMTKERIVQTLSNWEKESLVKNRYAILKQSIQAHIEESFYLSVSTLISQVEGLLRDLLISKGKDGDFGSMRKEDMKQATSILVEAWRINAPNPVKGWIKMLDSLMPAIVDLYEDYARQTAIPGKLYRHGVCHGHQLDFGSEKNSLRLILIIDRIIFFCKEFC